jgi:hypothetical protein
LEFVRLSVTTFFYTKSGGLVASVTDSPVLDCYRLAKYYHVSPLIFLEMGLSEVRIHLDHTIKLAHQIQRESEID